ncbi:MAG: hypothetical protein DMG05_19515, partial [Acidobacteria bacterium]
LQSQIARDLGVVGVAGRASGVNLDVRRDHPYAAYDEIAPKVTVYDRGDVFCRMKVRMDEANESIRIAMEATNRLSEGPVRTEIPLSPARNYGLGYVEGWRGEILVWIQVEEDGRISRCKIKDPSLNNWPALPEAVQGNIIPDFPVINKSFNLSYSGTDR